MTAALFLHDGKLAIGQMNQLIVIWDLVANKKLSQSKITELVGEEITALAQLPNGHLVCGDDMGCIVVYDLETKKHLQTIDCAPEKVLWLKVLPNGHLAACCPEIYIWDLSKKNVDLKRLRSEPEVQFGVGFADLFFDVQEWKGRIPSGNYLSKTCEVNIKNWDMHAEKHEDPEMIFQLNFELLSDGRLALSYLEPDGVNITIWNTDSGKVFKEIKFKGNDIQSCTILPSGDAVLCRKHKKVEVHSLHDKTMIHSFRNNQGPIVAIRSQSRHSLQFVHLKNPRLPILARDPKQNDYSDSYVNTICFSDDGKYIAVGSSRSKVVIWPLQS